MCTQSEAINRSKTLAGWRKQGDQYVAWSYSPTMRCTWEHAPTSYQWARETATAARIEHALRLLGCPQDELGYWAIRCSTVANAVRLYCRQAKAVRS